MSVVVRMEMPGCCWDCPCLDDCGDYPRCRISNEQRGYNFSIHEKRMPNCPIICSLPEGHGDLVEAKEITVNVTIKGKTCSADVYATTIVPAERSET